MATSSVNIFDTAGIRIPTDACVVIVRTAWNADIVDKLQEGAVRILDKQGVHHKIVTVPGAFEIGFAVRHYFDTVTPHPLAFIALGCVLQGDTPHFDYVSKAVTDSLAHLNVTLPVPVIFGVLTVNNREQTDDRTGGRHGHKGEEAAATALQMIHWMLSTDK